MKTKNLKLLVGMMYTVPMWYGGKPGRAHMLPCENWVQDPGPPIYRERLLEQRSSAAGVSSLA